MKKIVFFILILASLNSYSQVDTAKMMSLLDLPLDSLMNIPVDVATKNSVEKMKSPAVVSVITSSEIRNSGARDLRELLEIYVPSIQFGVDVEGAVGMGFRGMWSQEGKVLLLIDGIEMNEEMFGSVQFGNHYSLDDILKIEISRGPGSVLYGGYAALTVINVITKRAGMDALELSSSYSPYLNNQKNDFSNPAYSSNNLTFGYSNKKIRYSAGIFYQQGSRSNFDNVDYSQDTMSMSGGNSTMKSFMLNAGFKYKNFNFRQIVDLYHYKQIDLWGENHAPLWEKFDSYITDFSYNIALNKHNTLTPRFTYKFQKPWQLNVPDYKYSNSKYSSKFKFTLVDNWNIRKNMNLLSGIEIYQTNLRLSENLEPYEEVFINGTDKLELNTVTMFAQGLFFFDFANFTVGWRSYYSSVYGYTAVPRIAVTKKIKNFNFKLLFNQSYRVPGGIIPNRSSSDLKNIRPERGSIYELQSSYSSENFYFSVNLFDIKFNKIIVYIPDPSTGVGSYQNSGRIDEAGGELELRYWTKGLNLILNYAYYYSLKNDVYIYNVPGVKGYELGFSPNRLNFISDILLSKILSLNFVSMFYSSRYGYSHSENEKNILTKYPAAIISNIHFNFKSKKFMNIHFQVGASNIFNSKLSYIQPYMGGHAPLPSWGRTVDFKITWIIN